MANEDVLSDISATKSLIESSKLAEQKATQEAAVFATKINEVEHRLDREEREFVLNELYSQTNSLREQLLAKLVLQNALKKLKSDNEDRLKHLESIAQQDIKTVQPMTKKDLRAYVSDCTETLFADKLGLAPKDDYTENFFGHKLLVRSGKISAASGSNLAELSSMSEADLARLLKIHPEFVSTFSGEALAERSLRVKLLKQIAEYVSESANSKTIEEINDEFGGLLNLTHDFPSTLEYIYGVKNLFKVKVKHYLLGAYPDASSDVKALKCDETSSLLPSELADELSRQNSATESDSDALDKGIDEFIENLLGAEQ